MCEWETERERGKWIKEINNAYFENSFWKFIINQKYDEIDKKKKKKKLFKFDKKIFCNYLLTDENKLNFQYELI